MLEKRYSVNEVCKLAGFHRDTILKHAKSGKIESFMVGDRYFFNQQQLDKLVGK